MRQIMRLRALAALPAAFSVALLAGCGGSDNGGTRMHEVRMAAHGAEDNPELRARWTAYKALIERATGLPVKLYESSDYNGSIQAMASNQVDLAMLAGGGYANLDAQVGKLAAPILTYREAEGGTGYYSVMMVKRTSPFHTLADLKGHTLGYVDFNSTSGYLYPRAKMREEGIDPDHFFGKTTFAGGHTQAVMALENGQFDAAVLYMSGGTPQTGFSTGALYTMSRQGMVKPEDFRSVWSAGPIPNAAIVVRTDRPQSFIDTIRGAFAAMPYDDPQTWSETGQPGGSTVAAVDRSHYATIIKLRADSLAQRRKAHS
jgi:phosphonate transport system substrate-binding protein